MMGLSPRDFWALRLIEWQWLNADLADGAGEAPLDRAGLHHLITLYPDEKT